MTSVRLVAVLWAAGHLSLTGSVRAADSPKDLVVTLDGKSRVGVVRIADDKVRIEGDEPFEAALEDVERIEFNTSAGFAVSWAGQGTADYVQVGAANAPNGVPDMQLRLTGLPGDREIKQIMIVGRLEGMVRGWRLDPSNSPHWRAHLERGANATTAEVYLEPAAKDALNRNFEITITFADGTTAKSSVVANSSTTSVAGAPAPAAPPLPPAPAAPVPPQPTPQPQAPASDAPAAQEKPVAVESAPSPVEPSTTPDAAPQSPDANVPPAAEEKAADATARVVAAVIASPAPALIAQAAAAETGPAPATATATSPAPASPAPASEAPAATAASAAEPSPPRPQGATAVSPSALPAAPAGEAKGDAVGLATLTLDDRQTVTGKLIAWGDDAATLRTAWAEEFRVPMLQAAALRFQHASAAAMQKDIDARLAARGESDVVFSVSKEGTPVELTARVQGLDGERLQLEYEGAVRGIALSRIVAVVFAKPAAKKPLGVFTALELSTGDRLIGRIVDLDDSGLRWASLTGGTIAVDRKFLQRAVFYSGRQAYLSDMEPTAVEFTPYFDRQWTLARDRALGGGPLKIKQKTYPKGLSMHSRTAARYELAGSFAKFRADAGFEADVPAAASADLAVLGDGKVLWEQKGCRPGDPVPVSVDVSGVKELELLVDFGDNEDVGDRVVWGGAQVTR